MTDQNSNLQQFNALVATHVAAIKAHATRLWDAKRDELLELAKTPVAEHSDDVLADIGRRFLWDEPQAVHAELNGIISTQRFERFKLVCELSGLGSDTEAALARGDAWDVAATHGITREHARAAAEMIEGATAAGQGIDEFLAQCQKERLERVARERARWLDVDGQKFRVLAVTPVLWSGWECDSQAWVIERDGQRVLVTTDHGAQVQGNEEMLRGKLVEYRQAIEDTERLLAILGGAPAQQA